MRKENEIPQQGLYRESFEHDNCGIGAIVNIKGQKSHSTVAGALHIVENLEHRAGKDAEGKTGDGVGILTQIPHNFFKKVCQPLGIDLKGERDYGVGMFFLPQDELKRNQVKKIFEVIVKKEGLKFLGWREVPIHPDILGKSAVDCMPCIMQAFIERPSRYAKGLEFDRRLYVVRRIFEQSSDDTYVVSLSSRTIVYKGMFLVGQLRLFFADLQDEESIIYYFSLFFNLSFCLFFYKSCFLDYFPISPYLMTPKNVFSYSFVIFSHTDIKNVPFFC